MALLFVLLASTAAAAIIGGQGAWQYQYMPDLVKLPVNDMLNGHGLAKDTEGNIYFCYQPKSVSASTRALVKFTPDGVSASQLGDNIILSEGTPHGLRISFEDNGAFLYHANNNQLAFKTTLDGRIIWRKNFTDEFKKLPYWPLLPTDIVVPPGSRHAYLADGYGSSFVHVLDKDTGDYLNITFGGKGNSTDPQRFNCPHGLNWDPWRKLLVVSDRANARIQYVNLDGVHQAGYDFAPLGAGFQLPDNVDLTEQNRLVPTLDGNLAVLDADYKLLSSIEVAKLLPSQCPHPHDAIFLSNMDIILCCWNPGFVSYWKRMPAAPAIA